MSVCQIFIVIKVANCTGSKISKCWSRIWISLYLLRGSGSKSAGYLVPPHSPVAPPILTLTTSRWALRWMCFVVNRLRTRECDKSIIFALVLSFVVVVADKGWSYRQWILGAAVTWRAVTMSKCSQTRHLSMGALFSVSEFLCQFSVRRSYNVANGRSNISHHLLLLSQPNSIAITDQYWVQPLTSLCRHPTIPPDMTHLRAQINATDRRIYTLTVFDLLLHS